MMAIFCQSCGGGLPVGARFCSRCGSPVPAAHYMPGQPLVRPRIGRQIGGVCIALAHTNGWDVTLVRVLSVLAFVFSSGLVGVAYLAAWIGIPEEPLPFPGAYPPGI